MSLPGILADLDNSLLGLLAVLCLVMLSVSMLRRSQARMATRRDLSREQLARLRDQKELHQSMDDLLVQLEEAARRVNAQIDTRFLKLETVIQDADQRIAELRRLQRVPPESATTAGATPRHEPAGPTAHPAALPQDSARDVFQPGLTPAARPDPDSRGPAPQPATGSSRPDPTAPASPGSSSSAPAGGLGDAAPATRVAAPASSPSAAPAGSDPVPQTRAERFQRIYDLADRDTAPIAIADALGLPLGEVELILRLRDFQRRP